MANLLVYGELRDGVETAPTAFAVGEARRVADALGATVYALVVSGPLGADTVEALAAALGRAGADRVLFCLDMSLRGAPLDPTHGPVVAAVAERLRPLLALFPAGGTGRALAPPLAVRTGAAFCPHGAVQIESSTGDDGQPAARLVVRRWRPGGDGVRAVDVVDLERPVVVTLPAGRLRADAGTVDVDAQMLAYPEGASAPVEELAAESDPDAAAELAHAIVLADGADAASMDAVRAAIPAGVALVAGDSPLEACPERLLVTEAGAWPSIAFAPSARVAAITAKAGEKALPADLVLRPGKGAGLEALAAALSAARGEETDR